ncbi:MAG: hypothetical protein ACTSPY_14705 [Candidatus Helarchaeota archaeon]
MMLLGILLSLIFGFINTYIAKKRYNKNKDTYIWLSVLFIGILWTLCTLAAFNIVNFYWFLGYYEGNDFLWNWPFSFFLGTIQFDYTTLGIYELIIILTYPFWYKFSATRFHHFFGRRPWQKGMLYLFTVPKRPKGVSKGEKAIKAPLCDFKECDDDLSRKID